MPYYQYPLKLRFKLIALAPRIIVTDASGQEVMFISQKTFKLREDVRVFESQAKERELFSIRAEKIMDFNTRYNFTYSPKDQLIGSIKAKGWRSIWSATYLIDDPDGTTKHVITEDNPWVKVMDALFLQIPFIGALAGYVFHPSYTLYSGSSRDNLNQPLMQIKKESGFFEGVYSIHNLDESVSQTIEMQAILSFALMVQFMRRRG